MNILFGGSRIFSLFIDKSELEGKDLSISTLQENGLSSDSFVFVNENPTVLPVADSLDKTSQNAEKLEKNAFSIVQLATNHPEDHIASDVKDLLSVAKTINPEMEKGLSNLLATVETLPTRFDLLQDDL